MNNNIFKNISLGMLKKERNISLSIVLAIALNTAIIIAIIFSTILYVDFTNKKAIESKGSAADAILVDPTLNQLEVLQNDNSIDYLGTTISYMAIDNEAWQYVNNTEFKNNLLPAFHDLEGTYPNKVGEVLLPSQMASDLNIAVGDKIKNTNPRIDQQYLQVSGIYNSFVVNQSNVDFIYVSEQQFSKSDITRVDYSIKFKEDSYDNYLNLKDKLDLGVIQNYKYININELTVADLASVIVGAVLISLFSLFIILYNLLNIFNDKNIENIKKLNLIGISKKEVKKVLRHQMNYYVTRGILLGLLIGMIFIALLIFFAGYKITDINLFITIILLFLLIEIVIINLVFMLMHRDYSKFKSKAKTNKRFNKKLRKINIKLFNKLPILKYFDEQRKHFLIVLSFSISIIIITLGISILGDNIAINELEDDKITNIYVESSSFEKEDISDTLSYIEGLSEISSVGYITTFLQLDAEDLIDSYVLANESFDMYKEKEFALDSKMKEYEAAYIDDNKYLTSIYAIDEQLFSNLQLHYGIDLSYEEFEKNGMIMSTYKDSLIPQIEFDNSPIRIVSEYETIEVIPYKNLIEESSVLNGGVGIFPTVYISQANFENLYGNSDKVIKVFVNTLDDNELNVAKSIRASGTNIDVFSAQEYVNALKQQLLSLRIISAIILLFLILLVSLNFFTTIYIKFRSEFNEIMLFKKLGLKEKELKTMYTKELILIIINILVITLVMFFITRLLLNMLDEEQLKLFAKYTFSMMIIAILISSIVIWCLYNYIYKITVLKHW